MSPLDDIAIFFRIFQHYLLKIIIIIIIIIIVIIVIIIIIIVIIISLSKYLIGIFTS